MSRTPKVLKTLKLEPGQLRTALLGAWLIISFAGLGCVLFTLAAPDALISALSPQCVSMTLYGKPCPACGMTRGFMALSHGDISGAAGFNPAAPYVYFLLTINGLLAVLAALKLAASRLEWLGAGRGRTHLEALCKPSH